VLRAGDAILRDQDRLALDRAQLGAKKARLREQVGQVPGAEVADQRGPPRGLRDRDADAVDDHAC
jgi:hypothetical protein